MTKQHYRKSTFPTLFSSQFDLIKRKFSIFFKTTLSVFLLHGHKTGKSIIKKKHGLQTGGAGCVRMRQGRSDERCF